jgi:four helix bundle protein
VIGNAPQDIRDCSFNFAIRIIQLAQYLDKRPGTPRTLARQVLRSGTSIGANLQEAQGGISKAEFIVKNSIALKEARETLYWLKLLVASKIVTQKQTGDLQSEAAELVKILTSIILTAKQNAARAKGAGA